MMRVLFFQAEDGIRDLVRSRGLGDVYKRQDLFDDPHLNGTGGLAPLTLPDGRETRVPLLPLMPVSYTHLTLPTSDLV